MRDQHRAPIEQLVGRLDIADKNERECLQEIAYRTRRLDVMSRYQFAATVVIGVLAVALLGAVAAGVWLA